jgi:heptosyltransferase II
MNIALFKNRSLGDALMTLSSIQYLKTVLPKAQIHVFFPTWIIPIFKNYADEQVIFHAVDAKSVKGLWQLKKNLDQLKPSWVYHFHCCGRLSHFLKIYTRLRSLPYHFHSHHHTNQTGIPNQGEPIAAIQRDLNGLHFALKKMNLTTDNYPDYLGHPPIFPLKQTPVKEKKIILGLVASRITKMVPAKALKPLLKNLMEKYSDYKWICPITPKDQWIKNEYAELPIQWVKWRLEDLPLEFSKAQLYVGNDTGLKHLAISLNLRSFTFFGPELPSEWHPYNTQLHPYYFQEDLPCRTVKAHYCALTTCDSMICLNSFPQNEVTQTIAHLLES